MSETQSFRTKLIESCKENLPSRQEAIALIERTIGKINTIQTFKFGHPKTSYFESLSKDALAAAGIEVSNETPDQKKWMENPRHIITRFLQQLIVIFQQVAAENLSGMIEQCIELFKRDNPQLTGNISGIVNILKIRDLAKEIWFLETIETQKTFFITIAAIRQSTKKSVQLRLAQFPKIPD